MIRKHRTGQLGTGPEARLAAIEPFPVLDVDEDAQQLASRLLSDKAVPEEFPEDAMHIAVAAVNGIDILLTRLRVSRAASLCGQPEAVHSRRCVPGVSGNW